MIYLSTALYHEARPFIDHFGLKKNHNFNKTDVFENDEIRLVITGTGKIQTAISLATVLTVCHDGESIVNIGICGTVDSRTSVGDLFVVHEVRDYSSRRRYYPDILFDYNIPGAAVTTFDRPLAAGDLATIEDRLEIVDMEASGFYEAAARHFSPDKIRILKVVSDHLEGIRCTPELVTDIFAKNMDRILNVIGHKQEKKQLLTDADRELLGLLTEKMRFTETQKHMLLDYARAYKIRTGSDLNILRAWLETETKHKSQVKEHFETIKSLLFA